MSRKTKPYGLQKKHGKLHPHNECGICGEEDVNKKAERRKAKEDIKKELMERGSE